MSSGGGKTTTQVQKSDPWWGQQGSLIQGYGAANDYLHSNPQYYDGNTVAGFNPTQQSAQAGLINRATNGSPVDQSAQNQVTNTENGSYLNAGNPYMQANMNNVAADLVPRINSIFAGDGRYNSGANQNAIASGLSNAEGQMAYQNYAAERKTQMQGAAMAPGLANQDYTNLDVLNKVGAQQQQQQQLGINADIAKWNYNQNLPLQKIQNYMSLVQGNPGGTKTDITPYFSNKTGGAVGGAMAGATAGSTFGPWGAGIGAVLGAAGGYYGSQ